MSQKLTRREFVQTSTAASVALGTAASAFGQAPAMRTAGSKPVVIASDNGNVYKNGGTRTTVQLAFEMMTSGGKDVLDSLVAGVNLCELDPEESGVGYGGLPNAEGVVQLDSCCMHGPAKRAGGVAAIEGGSRSTGTLAAACIRTSLRRSARSMGRRLCPRWGHN